MFRGTSLIKTFHKRTLHLTLEKTVFEVFTKSSPAGAFEWQKILSQLFCQITMAS